MSINPTFLVLRRFAIFFLENPKLPEICPPESAKSAALVGLVVGVERDDDVLVGVGLPGVNHGPVRPVGVLTRGQGAQGQQRHQED